MGTGSKYTTMGVPSNGEYGIPKDIIYGFPTICSGGGRYEIVKGLDIDEFSKGKMMATLKELEEERDAVKPCWAEAVPIERRGASDDSRSGPPDSNWRSDPDDRALRLVFADWLLEQGDERGEVIALWARGNLSLTERRRVARITATHAAQLAGPAGAPGRSASHPLRGRLPGGAGVRAWARPGSGSGSLRRAHRRAAAGHRAGPHRACRRRSPAKLTASSATRCCGSSSGWSWGPATGRTCERCRCAGAGAPRRWWWAAGAPSTRSWRRWPTCRSSSRRRALGLSTTEFINPLVVDEIHEAVLTQHRALESFEELMLFARYGVLEGSAEWLLACDFEPRRHGRDRSPPDAVGRGVGRGLLRAFPRSRGRPSTT